MPIVALVTIIISMFIPFMRSATKKFFVIGVIIPPIPSTSNISCMESNFLNCSKIKGMSTDDPKSFVAS